MFKWIVYFTEMRDGVIHGEKHICISNNTYSKVNYQNSSIVELRMATPEEKQWLDACIKAGRIISKEQALKSKKELLIVDEKSLLIEEAKKRFPVGTKFYPGHLSGLKTEICIVTNDNFTVDKDGDIYSLTDDGKNYSNCHKYGNTNCDRVVYYLGNWAEIIPNVKKWDVGTYNSLPFGETIWDINREKGEASSVYGTITKAEITSLMKKIKAVHSTKLLGYNYKTELISVGCQKGTYEEIEAIYNELTR
jgi:hypothetical protein